MKIDIKKLLRSQKDESYQQFQKKICPTKYEIIGVKIPRLRLIAKELLKNYSHEELITLIDNSSFEEVMLKGFIIAKLPFTPSLLSLIKDYLTLIDNWALCDLFVSFLKIVQNNQEAFLEFIKPLLKGSVYEIRFSIVILLTYYINKDYLEYNLQTMLTIHHDDYYVKMAISWNLVTCLSKYYEETYEFLKCHQKQFDPWVWNKMLAKAQDSFKLSKDEKNNLKQMKIRF